MAKIVIVNKSYNSLRPMEQCWDPLNKGNQEIKIEIVKINHYSKW